MIHFSWGELFLGHQYHLFSAFMGFLVLATLVLCGRWTLYKAKNLEPASQISVKAGLEFFTSFITGLSDSVIGPEGRKMIPLFGAIFLVIWIQNLFTLFPGFTAATDNLNTTLALGVCVFILYNYYGVKAHGLGYIRHFLGPVVWLGPFILILELITHLVRPFSLALRLYGNMMGDHTVLSVFLNLVPFGIPVVFYFIGFFVCTMQAFVFTMLSMIYYSMAVSDEH